MQMIESVSPLARLDVLQGFHVHLGIRMAVYVSSITSLTSKTPLNSLVHIDEILIFQIRHISKRIVFVTRRVLLPSTLPQIL